jgi:Ca2+-binding RTX toxin-like protein
MTSLRIRSFSKLPFETSFDDNEAWADPATQAALDLVTRSAAPSTPGVSFLFEPFPARAFDVAQAVGSEAGGAALAIASTDGVESAAANGRFDIVIRYTGDSKYQTALTQAAERWSQIITGDIPDVNSGQYGFIDDLLIDASIAPIDGAGGILGQAGPDLLRTGSKLPAHGEMEFDSADVANMFANGTWTNVILHEIGHILGIGTIWSLLGLKNGAGDYVGARGLAEYRTLLGNPSAASVPIEHDGGSGTAGAHWDEDTFNAELMTGFAEAGGIPMPISRMTVGSLQDLGYAVSYAAADAYSLPGGPSGPPGSVIVGDAGNNNLVGTAGGDTIMGLGGNDTLAGVGGNDTLDGGTGNDSIDGGSGDDTAVFTGNLVSYALADLGVRITISGPDGSDTLVGVEHLRFADGTIHLNDGSTLFDTAFYDRTYLDVFHAGVDARAHYASFGRLEGRDPNGFFSSSWYLALNSDVRATGADPLDHYHSTGWREGRDPAPNFDTGLYLANNPDVAASGTDPLEHYLVFGRAEGRATHQAIGTAVVGFDAEYYLLQNPDVRAAGADPLQHFNSFGWREGRNPNALFDTAGYLSHYTDVQAAGINPLQHYEHFGWLEGRDPSAGFDTLKYIAAYPDIAAAHVNPLDHYLNSGIYEGRSPFADGIWH